MLKECKFCGQMVDVGDDEREGYYYCNCGGARVAIVKIGGKGEVKVTRRVTQANTLDAASVY